MTSVRVSLEDRSKRTIHAAPLWLIRMWWVVCGYNAARAVTLAVDGDWAEAVLAATTAAMCWLLAARHRDVNALMSAARR